MGIRLNKTNYPLVVGNEDKFTFRNWENSGSSVELKACVNQKGFSEKDIRWFVQNPEIVKIQETEKHTCIAKGRTTGYTRVFAELPNGDKAYCYITVIDNLSRTTVRSLELNAQFLKLQPGSEAELIPVILPKDIFKDTVSGNAPDRKAQTMNDGLRWETSDESVATVRNGRVKAVCPGEADITAISLDVGRKAVCHIEVCERKGCGSEACEKDSDSGYADTKTKELRCEEGVDGSIIELVVGETAQFADFSLPVKKGEKLQYLSENPYVVSVDENGKLYACSNSKIQRVKEDHLFVEEEYGTVDILVTAESGKVLRYPVRVREPESRVEALTLHAYKKTIVTGCEYRMTAVVSPAAALHREVIFESSAPEIVSLLSVEKTIDGLNCAVFVGKKEGEATLTAYCGGKRAYCQIYVVKERKPVREFILPETLKLELDEVTRLAPVYDETYTEAEFFWLSTNCRIATVSREGWVKGYEEGSAEIYAVAVNNICKEDREALYYLEKHCEIEADIAAKQLLERILCRLPHKVIWIQVKKKSRVLRNLHIPAESITEESFLLLWNRDSLLWTKELKHYEIWGKGERIGCTTKLGFPLRHLQPNTEYQVEVRAVSACGNILVTEGICCRTRAPKQWLNVLDAPYFAQGDGSTADTLAIQRAINDCPENGVVYLPENHIYYTGALFLKSHMTLQVDGILMGSSDPKDYPMIVSRWEGFRRLPQGREEWANSTEKAPYNTYVRASLLNLGVYDEGQPGTYGPFNIEDVVIRGKGQINGNGFTLGFFEGPNQHNAGGGMPEPFSPIMNPSMRGSVIRIHNAKNIYVTGITLAYGPGWQVHPIYCSHLTFDSLELISKGNGLSGTADEIGILNGDGIDPDSCIHVNLFNCYFYVNDDSVTLKSGRNKEGNMLQKPNAYIRITDCISEGSKAGFVIGSEDAAGCHDILMQNLTVRNVAICGLWLKTMKPRGGRNRDIHYKDIVIDGSGIPVRIASEYASAVTGNANVNPADELPDIGYMLFENIRDMGKNEHGMQFVGLEESPLHDFTFRGVRAEKSGHPHQFKHCKNFTFENCEI